MFDKVYMVFDYDGDMIADNIESEEEARKLAESVFGYYVEQ